MRSRTPCPEDSASPRRTVSVAPVAPGDRALPRTEFGDYQTPPDFARCVTRRLQDAGLVPASIFEPTCGRGAFLEAALETWEGLRSLLGVEIDPDHCAAARARFGYEARVRILEADTFGVDWRAEWATLPDPLLVLGNPPWVTSADVALWKGENRPRERSRAGLEGMDALTGKSNFDLAEWVARRASDLLAERGGRLALLMKESAARKHLRRELAADRPPPAIDLLPIAGDSIFGVRTPCVLALFDYARNEGPVRARRHEGLETDAPVRELRVENDRIIEDAESWRATRHLEQEAAPSTRRWRSGIKHDCRKVMELEGGPGRYRNGYGEAVDIEEEVVFPLLKSTGIHRDRDPERHLIVPQRRAGEDPGERLAALPKARRYLEAHRERLDGRKSAVYRKRPPFSIFGIGDYSFAPAKVVVSGLHSPPRFRALGTVDGRPVVVDDTAYQLAAENLDEARRLVEYLESEEVRRFFRARIWEGDKRPVTQGLLESLDLAPERTRSS